MREQPADLVIVRLQSGPAGTGPTVWARSESDLLTRHFDVRAGPSLAVAQHGTGSRRLEKLTAIFLITLAWPGLVWALLG